MASFTHSMVFSQPSQRHMTAAAKIRIDKYLWAIRMYKTRGLATEACDKGRVRLDDEAVKPSRSIKAGDTIIAKTEGRPWVIRVKSIIDKRVAYAEAVLHYEDLTPPEDLLPEKSQATSFHTGKRLSKIGRPTKKQRRDLDDWQENS